MLLNSLALFLATSIISVPTPPGVASTDITAHHGTVYQTKEEGQPTEGFIEIINSGATDTLTAAHCPLANTTSIVDPGGKALTSLVIPAHSTVKLSPGQTHIALAATHFSVVYGAIVPCSLTFADAGTVSVYLYAVPAPKS